jgi:hypothetical protein
MAKYETMQIQVYHTVEDMREKSRLQELLSNLRHVSGKRNLYNIRLACEYYWCFLNGKTWEETKPRYLIRRG